MGGVALHRLDEVGDEVEPALELDIDLGPGVVHLVAAANEAVVGADDAAVRGVPPPPGR